MIFAYVPEIQPSWSVAEKVQFLKLKGVANLLSREIFDADNVEKKLIRRRPYRRSSASYRQLSTS
jgi:hypothetical protein